MKIIFIILALGLSLNSQLIAMQSDEIAQQEKKKFLEIIQELIKITEQINELSLNTAKNSLSTFNPASTDMDIIENVLNASTRTSDELMSKFTRILGQSSESQQHYVQNKLSSGKKEAFRNYPFDNLDHACQAIKKFCENNLLVLRTIYSEMDTSKSFYFAQSLEYELTSQT